MLNGPVPIDKASALAASRQATAGLRVARGTVAADERALGNRADELLQRLLVVEADTDRAHGVAMAAPCPSSFAGLIGATPGMRQLVARLVQLAPLTTPVLITGETGTGKHLLAHTIHKLSQRSGPLLTVHATALPAEDLMLHLYGQERLGRDEVCTVSPGLLEQAQGGTLLFEDVAQLDAGGQRCLRQLLTEPTYSRRGSAQLRRAEVRVIALTSRPLLELVGRGAFCGALFHRLTPAWLDVPPLRQRREDIPRLAAAFLCHDGSDPPHGPPELPTATLLRLLGHGWPGNVRELREVLRQAVQLARERGRSRQLVIDPTIIDRLLARTRAPSEATFKLGTSLATVQRDVILMTLAALDGNKTDAAALLGVSRGALYSRLRTYGAQARALWRAAQHSPSDESADLPPAPPPPAGASRESGSRGAAAGVKRGQRSNAPADSPAPRPTGCPAAFSSACSGDPVRRRGAGDRDR